MTKRPRDTAQALLDARAGVRQARRHGTRVQAIVKRSRVNERMIYHHFGSKDGLYRAVLATMDDAAGAWQSCWPGEPARAPSGLKAAFGALFDRMTAHP